MGVRRFRSVVDMTDPADLHDALASLAAACAMSRVSAVFGHDLRGPRGVRRFRSVEEADAHRAEWEAEPTRPAPD